MSSQPRLRADEDRTIYSTAYDSAFVHDVTSAAAGSGDTGQELLQELGSPGAGRLLPSSLGFSASQPAASPACDLRDLVLPPRHLADSLLQCYWDLLQSLSPVLHQPTFMVDYNNLWNPPTSQAAEPASQDVIFYATMNMVMALGCQRNEAYEVTERENLGNEFYKRSQKLVSIETCDRYSLPLVQLLVIRSMWFLYSPFAERCWTAISLTIRIAQAIGLDNAKLNSQRTSQLTREMRRRVWYSCVFLDR